MKKLNCWEIKKCGREPGGKNIKEKGVCPAAIDTSTHGMNSGKNGGRICWIVAGTLSGDVVCGHFARNLDSCMGCDVFKKVKAEEGVDFCLSKLSYQSTSPVLHKLLLYNFARYEMQQSGKEPGK